MLVNLRQGDEVLFLNARHTPLLDSFFKIITKTVEFPWIIIWMIAAAAVRFRYFVFCLISVTLAGAVVQVMKHLLFYDKLRPAAYFAGQYALHFVEGVEPLYLHSFPSGHTASAFALFLSLALCIRHHAASAGLFLAAALVGFSRMYLLQHFLRDVYAGAIVGLISATLSYVIITRYTNIDEAPE